MQNPDYLIDRGPFGPEVGPYRSAFDIWRPSAGTVAPGPYRGSFDAGPYPVDRGGPYEPIPYPGVRPMNPAPPYTPNEWAGTLQSKPTPEYYTGGTPVNPFSTWSQRPIQLPQQAAPNMGAMQPGWNHFQNMFNQFRGGGQMQMPNWATPQSAMGFQSQMPGATGQDVNMDGIDDGLYQAKLQGLQARFQGDQMQLHAERQQSYWDNLRTSATNQQKMQQQMMGKMFSTNFTPISNMGAMWNRNQGAASSLLGQSRPQMRSPLAGQGNFNTTQS